MDKKPNKGSHNKSVLIFKVQKLKKDKMETTNRILIFISLLQKSCVIT